MDKLFKSMEEYAKDNSIPIIEQEGLEILIGQLKIKKPNTILEIGTAIGYSALKMNEVYDSDVISFEREEHLYEEAVQNINVANKKKKIKLIKYDFLDYDVSKLPKFDFIYIDGAKAQYYNFFNHIKDNLKDDGIMIFDNLDFHDFVFNDEKKANASKSLRQMIIKLERFLINIQKEEGYSFEYIKKGDGIGILKRSDFE